MIFMFLLAIQFVLSYEFHHLPKAQRESMLHSSAGQRSASAYVEIVFNNEDRRIPVTILKNTNWIS